MASVINLLDQKKNISQDNSARLCHALLLVLLLGSIILIKQDFLGYIADGVYLKHHFFEPDRNYSGYAHLFFSPVDINSASLEELTVLPDIGEKRAERILALKASVGFFFSKEELGSLDGPINSKVIRSLTSYIKTDD